MKRVTCRLPGGYSGIREPGGHPRLRLDLAEGDTVDVSDEKAAQLLRDFPGYFTAAENPPPLTAAPAPAEADPKGPRGRRTRRSVNDDE